MDPVHCIGCGVELPRTGGRGRPRKRCEGCRAKAYDCRGLPVLRLRRTTAREPQTSERVYCSHCAAATRRGLQANRAALKAQGIEPA